MENMHTRLKRKLKKLGFMPFDKVLKENMKDPEFKKEFDGAYEKEMARLKKKR